MCKLLSTNYCIVSNTIKLFIIQYTFSCWAYSQYTIWWWAYLQYINLCWAGLYPVNMSHKKYYATLCAIENWSHSLFSKCRCTHLICRDEIPLQRWGRAREPNINKFFWTNFYYILWFVATSTPTLDWCIFRLVRLIGNSGFKFAWEGKFIIFHLPIQQSYPL